MPMFLHLARSYWLTFMIAIFKSGAARNTDRLFLVEAGDAPRSWLKIRLRVLRRDRFRCRGCDKKGEDIPLTVHQIAPGPYLVDETLTLCLRCRSLAKTLELKGIDIPDFLRQLWFCLYRPVETAHDNAGKRNVERAANDSVTGRI
jgi:hypothetical protein